MNYVFHNRRCIRSGNWQSNRRRTVTDRSRTTADSGKKIVMMKSVWTMFVMLLAVLGMAITGCSPDKDEDPGGSDAANEQVFEGSREAFGVEYGLEDFYGQYGGDIAHSLLQYSIDAEGVATVSSAEIWIFHWSDVTIGDPYVVKETDWATTIGDQAGLYGEVTVFPIYQQSVAGIAYTYYSLAVGKDGSIYFGTCVDATDALKDDSGYVANFAKRDRG